MGFSAIVIPSCNISAVSLKVRVFPSIAFNTRHHQGAGQIGKVLSVTAVWPGGSEQVVEAVVHQEYPIVGTQWHPEKMYLYGDKKRRENAEKLLSYCFRL